MGRTGVGRGRADLARCGGEQLRERNTERELRGQQLTVRGDDVDLGVAALLGQAVNDGAWPLEVNGPIVGNTGLGVDRRLVREVARDGGDDDFDDQCGGSRMVRPRSGVRDYGKVGFGLGVPIVSGAATRTS